MSFYTQFAPYYSQVFPFRDEVYRFLRGYAGETGSELLDAGCGPGFYCGRFAHDGFRATGVDLDSGMIAEAMQAFPLATFRCMDISEAGLLDATFQMIYSVGNVLAYLSPERLQLFLATVYEKLSPGGFWVFQVVNWDYLLTLQEYTFPVKSIGSGDVEFHRSYPLISPACVTFEVELLSEGKRLFHEESTLYPLCEEPFLQQHVEAGFSIEGVYGGFDKHPFIKSRNSALIMVFQKRYLS